MKFHNHITSSIIIGKLFPISLIMVFFLNLIKPTLRSRSMIKISHVLKLSCQNDKILSPDSIGKRWKIVFFYF